MNYVFFLVARALQAIAASFRLTYEDVNIIAYYVILPFVFAILLDMLLGVRFLKIIGAVGIGALLLPPSRLLSRSEWLFQQSVAFLESFEAVGLNYVVASVVVCVLAPLILIVVLLFFM